MESKTTTMTNKRWALLLTGLGCTALFLASFQAEITGTRMLMRKLTSDNNGAAATPAAAAATTTTATLVPPPPPPPPNANANANVNDNEIFLHVYTGGKQWKLPKWGSQHWCDPPNVKPINYFDCNVTLPMYSVPFVGGLTNALKIILLSGIKAMQDGNRCWAINEATGQLNKRNKKENELSPTFLRHFFEPMGIPWENPLVRHFEQHNLVKNIHLRNDIYSNTQSRRVWWSKNHIPKLWDRIVNGHHLKKIAMRRIWRPHAPLREKVCGKLENHDLTEEYIAFSVRRGDKKELEHFEYQDLQDYIVRAEEEITAVFNGTVPKIFVATDDCTVMPEFQKLRPTWTFVSQCDNNDDTGFALYDVMDWTIEQTDAHFEKFMIELYGLAMGRVFIGVSYTNVAWWVYFMRKDMHNFHLIDIESKEKVWEFVQMW